MFPWALFRKGSVFFFQMILHHYILPSAVICGLPHSWDTFKVVVKVFWYTVHVSLLIMWVYLITIFSYFITSNDLHFCPETFPRAQILYCLRICNTIYFKPISYKVSGYRNNVYKFILPQCNINGFWINSACIYIHLNLHRLGYHGVHSSILDYSILGFYNPYL